MKNTQGWVLTNAYSNHTLLYLIIPQFMIKSFKYNLLLGFCLFFSQALSQPCKCIVDRGSNCLSGFSVFVSYAGFDADIVKGKILPFLEEEQIWYWDYQQSCQRAINMDDDNISRVINQSELIIIFFSNNWKNSLNCQKEYDMLINKFSHIDNTDSYDIEKTHISSVFDTESNYLIFYSSKR